MSFQTISFNFADGIAVVTINRPEILNSLSSKALRELRYGIDEADSLSAKAILFTGKGRAFSTGADLADPSVTQGDLGEALEEYFHPLFLRLNDLAIPVVSAINGPAVGAGMALAVAADISVMARSAYLQPGFVNRGLVADCGMSWLLARTVGRTRALELALLGERIEAERAHAMGLVTRVVDDEACFPEAMSIARRLASGPSIAIGLIRRQIAVALDSSYRATLAAECTNQGVAGRTADAKEAIAAFFDKREPHFRGA